ncbi:hypothetical protein FHU41_000352 [Psychromicrobium silvestre]|uniref:Uncharacterized protein n=1 Tax=Psychromicrobium silvestre TaxID=1645614 RepID=A0A7Y9S5N9_9MICC|nr:hypothetical protein [Psychromicrobium silvestre]NYE94131.1 hypothetical protein [Psychromicrobium silvestre]
MNINWNAFVIVAVATLAAALTVVTLFSFAVRLHAASLDRTGPDKTRIRFAEYLCYTLCAAAVLYGVYLIVPFFHGKS